MTTARDIFSAAMSIMDELSPSGEAAHSDTREYEQRAPAILNVMLTELKVLRGDSDGWLPVESLAEPVSVETNYALGAMPYGLAANLLVDENPSAASFYQQRYEELRAMFIARLPASVEDIELLYGGVGGGSFSRW